MYEPTDMLVGTGVATLTTELLEYYRFPNPLETRLFTPAFAVGLATGLGAVILIGQARNYFKQQAKQDRSIPGRTP